MSLKVDSSNCREVAPGTEVRILTVGPELLVTDATTRKTLVSLVGHKIDASVMDVKQNFQVVGWQRLTREHLGSGFIQVALNIQIA